MDKVKKEFKISDFNTFAFGFMAGFSTLEVMSERVKEIFMSEECYKKFRAQRFQEYEIEIGENGRLGAYDNTGIYLDKSLSFMRFLGDNGSEVIFTN